MAPHTCDLPNTDPHHITLWAEHIHHWKVSSNDFLNLIFISFFFVSNCSGKKNVNWKNILNLQLQIYFHFWLSFSLISSASNQYVIKVGVCQWEIVFFQLDADQKSYSLPPPIITSKMWQILCWMLSSTKSNNFSHLFGRIKQIIWHYNQVVSRQSLFFKFPLSLFCTAEAEPLQIHYHGNTAPYVFIMHR